MKHKGSKKDTLKGALAIVFLNAVALMPFRYAQGLGRLIGWCAWLLNIRSARITRINLAVYEGVKAGHESKQLVKASLLQTGQTLTETANIWLGDPKKNRHLIKAIHDEQILDNAIAKGKGVVIILPHLGNWELFNIYYQHEVPMTALYSPPDVEILEKFLKRVRNRFQNRLVPTTRSGLTELYRELQQGHVVTILPDQVPASGEFAPFFGQKAFTDTLIPRLVTRTGAAVICAYVKRRRKPCQFEVVFRAAESGVRNTDRAIALAAMNQSIEHCVNDIPEQYQWEYKRYRVQPEGSGRFY